MTNASSTILAIGAAGKFAGMVVPALTKRGARVRGFVTDAKQRLAVRSHGAAEVAVGDLRDETSVDYRDVAEVAAIALTENRLNFGTCELCAEGNLNRTDVAQIMSEVLGRGITASKSEIPKNKEPASSASEDPQNSAIQKMVRWYDSHGLLGNSLTLQAILGREPRTLRALFEELAAGSGKPK